MQQQNEIWKDVVGFEGLYQVSNLGKVRSIKTYKDKRASGLRINKPMILTSDRYGYLTIGLYKNGKAKRITIHRLVAISFIPNQNQKNQVNHKNGIKTDNRIENLEWVTLQENRNHAVRTGLQDNKGEKHHKCKLRENDVLEIRCLRNRGLTMESIAQRFGVCHQNVASILNGETWTHI